MHCLREKIYGEWDFHLSTDIQFVNLFETKEVCTHQLTNRVQILAQDQQFKFSNETIYKIKLKDNYIAEAEHNKTVVKGKWSPIYTQALSV